jgi:putative oxidoreductase
MGSTMKMAVKHPQLAAVNRRAHLAGLGTHRASPSSAHTMKKLLFLDFLPRSADLALLLIRLMTGLSMVWFHGRGKLLNFESMHTQFPDPLGVGSTTSLVLALFGEVLFPAFLALGLLTRLSALISAFTMGVAFFVIHGGALSGQNSGEMSYLYLAAFCVPLLAGGGRYSLDRKLGAAG